MFDFLKKKLGNAINSFSKKVEESSTEKEEKRIEEPIKEETPVEEVVEEELAEETPTEPLPEIKTIEKTIEISKIKKTEEESKKFKAKLKTKLKHGLIGKIKLSEKEISEFCWDFEMLLMESDVEIEAAQKLSSELKEILLGSELTRGDITSQIKNLIRQVLEKNMAEENFDLVEKSKENQPFIIMFIGPNGAGKTTTIAKIANMFLENKKTVVLAAADTFRAGSIQQIEEHAKKLNVKVVKHDYGADPAAVAYDAVASAKANKTDVVLIDTAGRQQTNVNLMDELGKVNRVAKPNLKIFVGEALAGQALIDQVETFKEKIGLDGVILTKIDTDVKGGGAISILTKLNLPILYVGTGQKYSDIIRFTPELILDRIL
ncbi:MAG: signal recognition particle-docking protein FtsY [Candidatus Diapherotrites archaeon]|nr:signal recognition particle-docking protein FtsY [Candidatus Diapherotrites archaeon]